MPTRADLPHFSEYFPPLVAALRARGGSGTIEELEDDVAQRMGLSEELLAVPIAGGGAQSYFSYRLSWARSFLKKAGAAENSERGVWRLTPGGAEMTVEDLRSLASRVCSEERRAKMARAGAAISLLENDDLPLPGEGLAPDDGASEDVAVELSWKEQLLARLGSMAPDAFERLCQRLLREAGFIKVEVTGRSGDGGIDGIGVLRVQLVSFQVLFQSKRWKGSVGSGVVRDFRGAMVGRADKGLIITTGTFTADARREATRDGAPAIDLVGGEALTDLLKQYGLGVTVRTVEVMEVQPTFFDSI